MGIRGGMHVAPCRPGVELGRRSRGFAQTGLRSIASGFIRIYDGYTDTL